MNNETSKNANGNFTSMRELAMKALQSAVSKLVLERRKSGDFLVVWRDGKVCEVPASEIKIPEDILGKVSSKPLI